MTPRLTLQEQIMNSREIADLANKRLCHVLRNIENMLQVLVETSPQFMGASKWAVPAFFTDNVNDDEAPACGLRYRWCLRVLLVHAS